MPTNTALKEDIIQQQILQAAQQLFQKHGYQKVTMDDVAKAIGKGRSSIYYYYKNKDEVFDAVMDAEISDIMAGITHAVMQVTTVEQQLRTFGITKTKISGKKRAFFEALETGMNAEEISRYTKKKQAIQKKMRKEEATLLHQILNEGALKGEIKVLNPTEQDTLVFVFATSLRGLKRELLFYNNRIEPAIDMLVRMTMQTIKR